MYRCYILGLQLLLTSCVVAFDCRAILKDAEIMYLEWRNLERCLYEVSGENLAKEVNENIWRLVKIAFAGIDNIPVEVYKKLAFTLTVIPLSELQNISMKLVETVEAFGAVRTNLERKGFEKEQLELIAQKVRHEWLGKNPQTYSEYDLIYMGEILCYLNVSDIQDIHPDALKEAVGSIGTIENCPGAALEALSKLAMSEEAFGAPNKWSKHDLSILGNIIAGLSEADIASIAKEKLHLNLYYHKMYLEKNKTNATIAANQSSTS